METDSTFKTWDKKVWMKSMEVDSTFKISRMLTMETQDQTNLSFQEIFMEIDSFYCDHTKTLNEYIYQIANYWKHKFFFYRILKNLEFYLEYSINFNRF